MSGYSEKFRSEVISPAIKTFEKQREAHVCAFFPATPSVRAGQLRQNEQENQDGGAPGPGSDRERIFDPPPNLIFVVKSINTYSLQHSFFLNKKNQLVQYLTRN